MVGVAFEPKTVAGVSKKAFYKKKKKAFTLAEVLITLAIIGVVAALTIPTVVAKYQQKALYSQFMKTYNTLSTALSMAQAENGPYKSWPGPQVMGATSGNYFPDRSESIKSNFLSNLKIGKICETAEDCGIPDDLTVSALNYTPEYDPMYPDEDLNGYYKYLFLYDTGEDGEGLIIFTLSDGALVLFNYNDRLATIEFIIDTNGIKGPNVVGRDIFYLTTIDKDGLRVLAPEGASYHNFTIDEFENDERFSCTTKRECYGEYCAARLLMEGKMSY